MKIELLINGEFSEDLSNYESKYVKCDINKIRGLNNNIITISLREKSSRAYKNIYEMLGKLKNSLTAKNIAFHEINNEISCNFQKILYPKLQKFETGLRKLLQVAVCDANDVLSEAYCALNKKLEGKKKGTIISYGLLNATDLQDIFEFLFVDKKMLQDTKEKFNENNWHLMNDLDQIKINSLWNTLFKEKFKGFELDRYCEQLYEIRNNVMHFHNFDYSTYVESNKLLNKLNLQLSKVLRKNIVLELNEKKFKFYIEETVFDNMQKTLSYYYNNNDFIKFTKVLKEFSDKNSEFMKKIETLHINSDKYAEIYNNLWLIQEKTKNNFNYINDILQKVKIYNIIEKNRNDKTENKDD